MQTSQYKSLRYAYGLDDVALVPGNITVNPEQTDISLTIGDLNFAIPVLASAMDAVVDVPFAIALSKCGGLAVLNLEGVQTRYEHPSEALDEIIRVPQDKVTALLQRVYSEPIKDNLIGERIRSIKERGGGLV